MRMKMNPMETQKPVRHLNRFQLVFLVHLLMKVKSEGGFQ